MPLYKSLLAASLLALCAAPAASAHEGALDDNGCHYDRQHGNQYHCHKDVPPNPDRNAPAKKSRENICHDRSSSNYRTIKYFISYRSMSACVMSGGVEAKTTRGGGLSNKPFGQ
jgi:hypothetical protein